jgi:L-alanine-DL-glutamate epimerase-like enolase superfamily enzyme|tara:strand:- start:33 stop:287 length:255 start_codon:yes stop_codon:yes gene_type:complete
MASVPNHYRVETARAKLNTYDVFIDHSLDIRGDKNYLSDRPGLGIELDKGYMRDHAIEGYGGSHQTAGSISREGPLAIRLGASR